MFHRPAATCLRALTTGDTLLGASAREGILRIPEGVEAYRRRRFGWIWRRVSDGARLRRGDRLVLKPGAGMDDARKVFRDHIAPGRAIHRPADAMTPLGKLISMASLLTACLGACALAGLAGNVLVEPDSFYYWMKRPSGNDSHDAYRRFFMSQRSTGRYSELISTPEQDARVRDALNASGLPLLKRLIQP